MNTDLAPAVIASAVARHLQLDTDHRKVFRSPAPPTRVVEVRADAWTHWLTDGGRPGTTSYAGPLDDRRVTLAAAATKAMGRGDEGRLTIDRELLVTLSQKAARGNERACITLWVATMMWGSGMANGRGPWRTAQGLASADLGEHLTASHGHLRSGDLTEAFVSASSIYGSGGSYFTRWLWAASLGLPELEPMALILDERRREATQTTIDNAEVWECLIGHGRRDYLDYVTVLHKAAAILRSEYGHKNATAEKVEWLLADAGALW